jgi:autophagy-related protein 18
MIRVFSLPKGELLF